MAAKYSEQQVLLCSINPFENPDLKKHLVNNRVPTMRVFFKGKVTKHVFGGLQNEDFVRKFFDTVVKDHKDIPASNERQAVRELKNSRELNKLVASAQVPVLVKFSAFF